ncbi:hypothetical protein [Streptomyces zagrosensis]|uniref:Integral membrane protein n=1 Tax=Streptomyces zagrosensis TaxID=1042984 RepID=A0A7W9UX48_9ACTN|nr:hypothetical protein [Streptomyces zagrosensis]MBB5934247.1 hypothetical protein [Streptomyces zagrosensis]
MTCAGTGLRLLRAAFFTTACVALTAGGHVLASCAAVPPWTLVAAWAVTFAVVAPLAGRERALLGIIAGLAAGQLVLHSLFALAQRGVGGLPGTGAHAGHAHAGGSTVLPAGVPPGSADARLIELAAQLLCAEPGGISAAKARQIVGNAGLDPASHAESGAPIAAVAPHGSGSIIEAITPSLPMVLGHLLAALAAGWLLRRGDAALWRIVTLSAAPAREVAEATRVRTLRVACALVRALRAGLPGTAAGPAPRPASAFDDAPARPRVLALHHAVIRRGPPRYDLAA